MGDKRNAGLELMRLAMMFGIVAMHAAGHCAYPEQSGHWVMLDWCVCGFVFLSGWFGIKFSVAKCVKMAALGVWCAFISNISGGGGGVNAIRGILGYWFLWAYIMLMMFAPVIDKAFAACGKREKMCLALPFLFIAYGWTVLCAIPHIRDFMPCPKGMGSCTFFSLVGIYVAVRLFREFNLGRFCTAKWAMIALPVCIALMYVGFWWYWWIPAFVVSSFAFEIFKRLKMPAILEKIILFLAPSAFAVYLLHIAKGGLSAMSCMERYLVEQCGWPVQASFVATAAAVFIVCLAIDVVRRVFIKSVMCFLPFIPGKVNMASDG